MAIGVKKAKNSLIKTTSLVAKVYQGTSYNDAQANSEANVADLIQVSDGTFIHSAKVYWKNHGLNVGNWYFLSQSSAGGYTDTVPVAGLVQQIFFVESEDFIQVDIEEAYFISQPIMWLSEINTAGGPDSLTKTSGGVSFNGQGVFGSIPASTNGSYFFTPTSFGSTANIGFIGMSDTPLATASFTDMTYAMFLNFNGDMFVYSNGSFLASFANVYSLGDEFEMKRTGTTVEFLRNGTSFYSFAVSSTEELFFDTSLRSPGVTLSNIKLEL